MFWPSTIDESELLKLIENHLLPSHAVLQWQSANDEDIPTPNTNEIIVLTSFFQHEFGLPTCEFLHGLLHYYKIELVDLNPNSRPQIVVFVHVCETYLAVLLNFCLFKHYFFLKYQPSTTKSQVIDIHTHPYHDFLNIPSKMSIKGWHKQWFYYENHIPGLPPFVGRLPEYDTTWVEEPVDLKMAVVTTLAS
jgi:hypothetical protein